MQRREFVSSVSMLSAGILAGHRPAMAMLNGRPEPAPSIQDSRLKELVQRGLDITRNARVSYADVRLTNMRKRSYQSTDSISEDEALAVSVRVLFNGYWGFACSPIWSFDEIQRVAQAAIAIAKTNAQGKPRDVSLAPVKEAGDGHWVMPVRIDPFEVSPDEILDHLVSLSTFIERTPGVNTLSNSCEFVVTEKAFGSTDGIFQTQRVYRSRGTLVFKVQDQGKQGNSAIDLLTEAGVGWELYRDQSIRDAFRQELEELRFDLSLPVKPVEVGRFDAVMDAQSVSGILASSIGDATLLTRAMGFNANDRGTSYITDPLTMLGTFRVGGPLLNVSMNRNEPGGLATVRWDDEGVAPVATPLVTGGLLSGFSTTRESASWLTAASAFREQTPVSSGCANAGSAIEVPVTVAGNLQMAPGETSGGFLSLIQTLDRGVAFRRMPVTMDFQCLNGFGMGKTYEIRGGKRIGMILNAGVLFRTPEFFKSVAQIGGASSAARFSGVTAVPLIAKDMTVVDVLRKA